MKNWSLWGVVLSCLLVIVVRCNYFTNNSTNGYNATTYDALGYYMYSPAIYLHKDVKKLEWFPEMDSTYKMSGGLFYQATPLENGNFAFKYFGGVSIMQLPFFATGHVIAKCTDAPEDGFSWPYQYAIIWGAICWFILGMLVLRKVLLRFYSETVTAITLVLIAFATNLVQYVGIDGAQSHAYIFPLYCLVLWWTIRWHETPKKRYALLIGLTIGLATICRPTELIMFFIPLLWGLDNSGNLKSKWILVKANKAHIYLTISGAVIGILPQLIYWKYVTGSWVYDVGSKWTFLNPWWRVLVGFEKGWFIYTPITVFMVIGLFLMKGKPYRKAVMTFSLLNIWVVISWFDWRYGGTYSSRAMVQSYPVFALALAACIERVFIGWRKWLFVAVGAYLCFVNLFQIWQYNETILHYDHMNARYYNAIYLDANPTPLDYSLLDTDEIMPESQHWKMISQRSGQHIRLDANAPITLFRSNRIVYNWLVTKLEVKTTEGIRNGTIHVRCFRKGKLLKERMFRMAVPRAQDRMGMMYENHVQIPNECDSCSVQLESWSKVRFEKLRAKVYGY